MTFANERALRAMSTLRTLAATNLDNWDEVFEQVPHVVRDVLLMSQWDIDDTHLVLGHLQANNGKCEQSDAVILAHLCTLLMAQILDDFEEISCDIEKSIDYWKGQTLYPLFSTVSRLPVRINTVAHQTMNRLLSPMDIRSIIGVPSMIVRTNSEDVEQKILHLKTRRNVVAMTTAQAVEAWLQALSTINVAESNEAFHKEVMSYSNQCVEIARDTLECSGSLDPSRLGPKAPHFKCQKLMADMDTIMTSYPAKVTQLRLAVDENKRPSWVIRNWLKLTIYGSVAGFSASYVTKQRASIKVAFVESKEVTMKFLQDYVIEPLTSIYNTIRFDTEKDVLQQRAHNLEVETESLRRMVVEFAGSHAIPQEEPFAAKAEAPEISAAYQQVLMKYAADIKHPLKNALTGDMVQNVLIQVQKQKVDAGSMMAAIDNLMASNELNFQMLTAFPTLYLFFYAVSGVWSSIQRYRGVYSKSLILSFNLQLRKLQKLNMRSSRANTDAKQWAYKGRILGCLAGLRRASNKLSAGDESMFLSDIRDLEKVPSGEQQVRDRVHIVNRIYRSYDFLK